VTCVSDFQNLAGGSSVSSSPQIQHLVLAEYPSAVTDDLVALASGITGIAQRQPSGFQLVAVGFDEKASDRQVATRLSGAQTGPVAIFYGFSCRRIQAPGGVIAVIMGQVGADDEHRFRPAP